MCFSEDAPPTPISNAYWVVPGIFLAGEHPLLVDHQPLEDRLHAFLNAGITLFLDLTDEEESTELGEYLRLMQAQQPMHRLPITRRHFPIRDMSVPSPEQMHAILATIDHAFAHKQTVYVHCWGGLGRTGTVVGCYLVQRGLNGVEALEEITQLRRQTRDYRYPAPSNDLQRQMVLNWRTLMRE